MDTHLSFLILEDNELLLEIIHGILENHFNNKVKIINSTTLSDAISIISKETIDVCLCDHYLTNNELGSDLLKYIKTKNLPIKFVLCSSYTPDNFPELYPHAQVFSYIQKPEIEEGVENLILKLESINFAHFDAFLNNRIQNDNNANLNEKLTEVLSTSDIPISRKFLAIYYNYKSQLTKLNVIPDFSDAGKNTFIDVVNNFDTESDILKSINDSNKQKLICIHSILLGVLSKKIELNSSKDLYKLIYLCFILDLESDKISSLSNPPYGILDNLNEIKAKLNSEEMAKRCSPTCAIFVSSYYLAKKILELNSEFNSEEFLNYLSQNGYEHGEFLDSFKAISQLFISTKDL